MPRKGVLEGIRKARLASEAHKKALDRQREYRRNSETYKAYNREYKRATREKWRELGICISCGKEDAFGNFSRCVTCLEKETLNQIKRTKAQKHRRKAEGQ